MDKWLLRFILLFKNVFQSQGIDVERMKAIVETKLLMDKRRVNSPLSRQKDQQDRKNRMRGVLFSYGIMGLFISLSILIIPSFVLSMIIFHAYILFMVAITLIADFSTVLLDTTDNQIILPTPVNGKTLFMARVVHILIYLMQIAIGLCLLPVAAMIYQYGLIPGLGMILTVSLSILLSVFFTYILYLLVLRFSNEQKLREVITNFQIFIAIFFVAGYQILPRFFDFAAISDPIQLRWYAYLLPPVWMSLTLEGLYLRHFNSFRLLMGVLTLLVPLGSFWILIRFLSPSFNRKLGAVANDPGGAKTEGSRHGYRFRISSTLSRLFCRTGTERGIFDFVWKISGRDKGFRLQFYPSLAIFPVLLFLILLGGGRNMYAVWQQLPSTDRFMSLIYLPMLNVTSSVFIAGFIENYQASWIYYSAPIEKPGELLCGAAKALFIKYFMIFYALLYLLAVKIWGWGISADFLFGLVNNWFLFLVWVVLTPKYLPFSRAPNTLQQTGKVLLMILQVLIVGVLITGHYLILHFLPVKIIVMAVELSACWLLINTLRDISWQKILT